MHVGIYQRGRPVVTAGDFQEQLVAPGEGRLTDEGEDGLLSGDGGTVLGRVLGVSDEILSGNHQAAVRILAHALDEVVIVFPADESGEVPVGTKVLVEHQVCVQVALLLGGKAHRIGTAFVHESVTQLLVLTADIVIIVVAFGYPLEPRGKRDGELDVRAYRRFLLILVGIVESEPHATAGRIAILVAKAALGNTAILALIARAPVAGIVQTAPGTIDEILTEVGHAAARRGVRKVDAGFQFQPVRNLVRSLSHKGKTAEVVIRRGTV